MKYYLVLVTLLLTACGQMKGAPGLDGQPGIQGATGPTGSDAASVTMVKLCPGDVVYPTTFVEYAFCVDSQLYATYSANGGFTTLLPPGRYSSNGINSRCDFTVAADCQITFSQIVASKLDFR